MIRIIVEKIQSPHILTMIQRKTANVRNLTTKTLITLWTKSSFNCPAGDWKGAQHSNTDLTNPQNNYAKKSIFHRGSPFKP